MRKVLLLIALMASIGVHSQTLPAYIPANNLLLWLPFNGNANNEYGTGMNGGVMGPVLTTDRFGAANSAYHFNGDGDHITIDTNFFDNGWSNYTISCWLNSDTLYNPNAGSNNQTFLNTMPHNGLELSFNWASNKKFDLFCNSRPPVFGWNILRPDSSASIGAIHTWNHIVFVKKDDTTYHFYLNGVLDQSFTRNTLAISYLCKIVLGRVDTNLANEGFQGKLDDYGIWTRALEACEVARIAKNSATSYITVHPLNITTPAGTTARFRITDTGAGHTYQWQKSTGTTYTDLANTAPYSGVTTHTLTVTSVTSTLSGTKYRCVVKGTGVCVDTSNVGKLTIGSTGVVSAGSGEVVTLHPNPTTGNIFVGGIDQATIRVYNMVGQPIKEADRSTGISIGEYPAGMYVVKVLNEQGVLLHTGAVIKQ